MTTTVSAKKILTGLLLVALPVLAGCSGGTKAPSNVTIASSRIGNLGVVLTTSDGHALYSFPPDKRSKVTCTSSCAESWPPVYVASGGKVVAGSGVQQSLLGTVSDGGKDVVTYDKWPLYTYKPDVEARTAVGQALNLNGGYWYVLNTAGRPVTRTYSR